MNDSEDGAAADRDFVVSEEWRQVHQLLLAGRLGRTTPVDQLSLSDSTTRYLLRAAPAGVYEHQAAAIKAALDGADTCLTSGTASGKTLAFHAVALERLQRDPNARIFAIYPQKSLGLEQYDRWCDALTHAGLQPAVTRIDGSIRVAERAKRLAEARIVVMTPDVMHAWLLSNLADATVRAAIASLSLIVLDEVHTYSGVFGSNSAFLLRRLRHAATRLGAHPQFFCASATIKNPEAHLADLCGVSVSVVGEEHDSSPRQPLTFKLLEPTGETDFLSTLTRLLQQILDSTDRRFVVFVDSRKLTEQIATILGRESSGDRESPAMPVDGEALVNVPDEGRGLDRFVERARVLPYRAGYEDSDRTIIQARLSAGDLRGVVSTSALELGIDIPHLDLAVLVGVPRSATSFRQRVGRVGRKKPGTVLVLNSGSPADSAIFKKPELVLDRPLAESTLYLSNARIQYMHALCLVGSGGELEALPGGHDGALGNAIDWPKGFVEHCRCELSGQVPPELRDMQIEAADDPHHAFPLRDVERQFKIQLRSGMHVDNLGSLSFGQVLREAYPGAIYMHLARPYRVSSVSFRNRTVTVRNGSYVTTAPLAPRLQIFPNASADRVFNSECRAALGVMECELQVREAISGFQERRAGQVLNEIQYPVDGKLHKSGVWWPSSTFSRTYFTTGVVLTHPALGRPGVKVDQLAVLLLEALLLTVPLDRQDLGVGYDKARVSHGALPKGQRFLAVFDQTYGSLRLSGRLLDPEVFGAVLDRFAMLVDTDESLQASDVTRQAVSEMVTDAGSERTEPSGGSAPPGCLSSDEVRCIAPGSTASNLNDCNCEYEVSKVFYSPKLQSVAYTAQAVGTEASGQISTWPIDCFEPIPGVTRLACYNLLTGEVRIDADDEITEVLDAGDTENYD